LSGVGKKIAPPIQPDVIVPAVTKQLADKLGDRFVKVGKVQYDAPQNCYHVEIFYNDNDSDKRYVMSFIRFNESKNRPLVQYFGQFPLDLVGKGSRGGQAMFPVTIDEMMNK
jgi:hypothetical protein